MGRSLGQQGVIQCSSTSRKVLSVLFNVEDPPPPESPQGVEEEIPEQKPQGRRERKPERNAVKSDSGRWEPQGQDRDESSGGASDGRHETDAERSLGSEV